MPSLKELGAQMLKIETVDSEPEQHSLFRQIAYAEQTNQSIDDTDYSAAFANFIDLTSLRLPRPVTSQLRFMIASLADGDEGVALLLFAAVHVLAEKHRLPLVGAQHLISHYDFDVPDMDQIKKLATESNIRFLSNPVSWSR